MVDSIKPIFALPLPDMGASEHPPGGRESLIYNPNTGNHAFYFREDHTHPERFTGVILTQAQWDAVKDDPDCTGYLYRYHSADDLRQGLEAQLKRKGILKAEESLQTDQGNTTGATMDKPALPESYQQVPPPTGEVDMVKAVLDFFKQVETKNPFGDHP